MKISARPFQRPDARTPPEAAPTATGGEPATPELWPPPADDAAAEPTADAVPSDASPSDSLLEAAEVDEALSALDLPMLSPEPDLHLKQTQEMVPVSTRAASPRSEEQDRAAVRATFQDLAALHISPVRNLMLEVRWGEPPTRFIALARPALVSLRTMAVELEMDDLVRGLDGLDATLAEVVRSGDRVIRGEHRESLLGAYFPLQRSFSTVFGLEGGRERREPIIIDALLEPVGLDQSTVDRLCLVGLGRLEPLLKARADEISAVADIPRSSSERIVARIADLVASAPRGLTGRRALEEWLLGELSRSQLLLRLRRGERLEGVDLRGARLPGVLLGGVTLAGADLEGVNLEGAVLLRADLHGARLRGANLAGADLSEANLQGADLVGADLAGANLTAANLSRANLISASFKGARLASARLSFATLTSAQLDGASLEDTNLLHADLERASLLGVEATGADLSGAFLKDAVLRGGHFARARFAEATLEGARAQGAIFEGASFESADLRWADLTRADLRRANLSAATLDMATLNGARTAGLLPTHRPAPGLHADWLDPAEVPATCPPGGDIATVITGSRDGWAPGRRGRRSFRAGEHVRDALVEIGEDGRLTVESLFERCLVRLRAGAELVVEETGALVDCQVEGAGALTVRGRVHTSPGVGLVGLRRITVGRNAVLAAVVQQPPQGTSFEIAHGARLRLEIRNPVNGPQ